MKNKLFVGNIPFVATDEELNQHFSQVGKVEEARIIRHRDTNKSRGFGFVTMSTEAEAEKAIKELNEKPLKLGDVERNLFVKEAIEKKPAEQS
jgi:cold-inducible RNA-binding protein